MHVRRSLVAVVSLAVTTVALPALAAEDDADGCRDITSAKVEYHPDRSYDEGLTPLTLDDGGWVYDGGGTVVAKDVTLAAPACRYVDYTVYIYADELDENGLPVLLGARPLTGEGMRPTVLSYDSATDAVDPVPDSYFQECVRIVLETASGATGEVFDRAADDDPDVDMAYRKVCSPDEARTWN
ncbi:MAG: hypothetical protein KY457_02315 [Actinobacteria bacterium]|nr:hypothetical protein [Actinomycetota bacterium]